MCVAGAASLHSPARSSQAATKLAAWGSRRNNEQGNKCPAYKAKITAQAAALRKSMSAHLVSHVVLVLAHKDIISLSLAVLAGCADLSPADQAACLSLGCLLGQEHLSC